MGIMMGIGSICLYIIASNYLSNRHQSKQMIDRRISNQLDDTSNIRLICISDTHNGYDHLTKELNDLFESEEKDILIHAGDMTNRGSKDELMAINEWFDSLPYKHKIVISGNMDGIGLHGGIDGHKIFTNAVYLEHESYEIEEIGIKIFGSPYTPKFVGGFQLYNDEETALKWKQIPSDADILIVHGPPKGILDATSRGMSIGDGMLLEEITNRVKPKAVVFGHVHASFGTKDVGGIKYVNAAQFNGIYNHESRIKPVAIITYLKD